MLCSFIVAAYFAVWSGVAARSWSSYSRDAASLHEASASIQQHEVLSAAMWSWTARLVRAKCKAVLLDRRLSFNAYVDTAAAAAQRNDYGRFFMMVKSLAGNPPDPHKGIHDESGVLLTDSHAVGQRWLRHHAKVLSADVCQDVAQHCPPATPTPGASAFSHSLGDVHRKLRKLNGDLGVGPDGISAHVLQRGGQHLELQLHSLVSMSISTARYLVPWRGGHLANLSWCSGGAFRSRESVMSRRSRWHWSADVGFID